MFRTRVSWCIAVGAGSKAPHSTCLLYTSFKHPAPGYVRYQRPPVVETIDPLVLESGERLLGQIKYYDYGVLSVVFELPFSGDWDTLVGLGGRWVWDLSLIHI